MKHAPIGPTIAVGDVQSGRHGVRPHPQPEPAGAARPDRDDARYAGGQRRRAHLRGTGPLRAVERRQRRRRRRSGDPLASRRQARASAVDAPRGSAVVHAVAGRVLRRPHRRSTRQGTITAYKAKHYMPAMQDDRLVGAIIAGLPTPPAPAVEHRSDRLDVQRNSRSVALRARRNVAESGLGTFQVGQRESPLEHRPARPQHADAGTVAAELSRANSR